MTFKEQILTDMSVFINTDEFGDTITIAGETVEAVVILDDETPDLDLDSRQGKVYVAVASLSSAPSYKDPVVIDGVTWKVFRDHMDNAYLISDGMYIIPIFTKERVRYT